MKPSNLFLFRFPGYGPDLSHGVGALTSDGRLIVTDAVFNPGTSVRHSIEIAVPVALHTVGRDELSTNVYLWAPDDPLSPGAMWLLISSSDHPEWERIDWEKDPVLAGSVAALRRALGYDPVE